VGFERRVVEIAMAAYGHTVFRSPRTQPFSPMLLMTLYSIAIVTRIDTCCVICSEWNKLCGLNLPPCVYLLPWLVYGNFLSLHDDRADDRWSAAASEIS
jgi:hypothetical protein